MVMVIFLDFMLVKFVFIVVWLVFKVVFGLYLSKEFIFWVIVLVCMILVGMLVIWVV